MARHRTARGALRQPGPQKGESRSRLKERSRSRGPLGHRPIPGVAGQQRCPTRVRHGWATSAATRSLCAIGARATGAQPALALACSCAFQGPVRVMSHTSRTGTMRMCAHGRCQGKGARESLLDWALHAIGSGRGSGCVLLCNGLLRLCVSVDRDRSRVRPLPAYVSRALKTVDFRVSPAPPGLAVSGLRDPRWAGRAARSRLGGARPQALRQGARR